MTSSTAAVLWSMGAKEAGIEWFSYMWQAFPDIPGLCTT